MDKDKIPTTSIIVPTYNNFKWLSQCIQHVQDNATDYELIIVDNGSHDLTRDYIEKMQFPHVVYLRQNENLGFAASSNIGAKQARGKYLLFLNDDAFIFKNTIPNLIRCAESNSIRLKEGLIQYRTTGIVGAVSNYAGGLQSVPLRRGSAEADLAIHAPEVFAQEYENRNSQNYIPSDQFISGFCMLVKREVYERIIKKYGYFFDEAYYPGGFEDNDLCIAANKLGYNTVACADAFVFHKGSVTFKSYFPHMAGGMRNYMTFIERNMEKRSHKSLLIGIHRVKIQNDFFKDVFVNKTLAYSSKTCDMVLVLDDGSPVKYEIPKEYKNVKIRRYEREFNERRDRNELIEWAEREGKKLNPDADTWIFSLDSDEVPENKCTRNYLDRLINPPDPRIRAYRVSFYALWDSETRYRTDDTFGNQMGIRLWRQDPGMRIIFGNALGFHCGNSPPMWDQGVNDTSIRIKHYGYIRPEDRQQKAAWYNKIDIDKNPDQIGHADYSHCCSPVYETNAWQEQNGIELCMIVRNEEEYLPSLLQHVWSFVDQVNVIDCRSIDRSYDILKLYGCNLVKYDNYLYATKKNPDDYMFRNGPFKDKLTNISEARNASVEISRLKPHEWVLVMDADEMFYAPESTKPSFLVIRRMMEDMRTFAYYFVAHNHQQQDVNGQRSLVYSETIRLFRKFPELRWKGRDHENFDSVIERCGVTRGMHITAAPIPLHHFGYMKNQLYVEEKLQYYDYLNKLEQDEDPGNGFPLFNRALHFINMSNGHDEYMVKAVDYLKECIKRNPNFYQAQKQLALIELKIVMYRFLKILQCLPPGHYFAEYCRQSIARIKEMTGDDIKVGAAALNKVQNIELLNELNWVDNK